MKFTKDNTEFDSWFERDRAYVGLTQGDKTIIELWDDEVQEFVTDGFKSASQDWHTALINYANSMGLKGENMKTLSQQILGMIDEKSNAWDVYLDGKLIDTVYSSETDPEEMKKSLINHDGYDSGIEVKMAEAAGDPSDATKARHDKENMELAKITVEQNKMLQAIYKHVAAAANAAYEYDRWMERNKVQALLNKDAEQTAQYIHDELDQVKATV